MQVILKGLPYLRVDFGEIEAIQHKQSQMTANIPCTKWCWWCPHWCLQDSCHSSHCHKLNTVSSHTVWSLEWANQSRAVYKSIRPKQRRQQLRRIIEVDPYRENRGLSYSGKNLFWQHCSSSCLVHIFGVLILLNSLMYISILVTRKCMTDKCVSILIRGHLL